MKNLDLTVIVPRLPPAIDGLGDYGLILARQMRHDFGINTHFIVGDPFWEGPNSIDGFHVSKVSKRSKKELLTLLSLSNSVLLHYVGYGYAKRGCPLWLIRALKVWRKKSFKKCVVMFHECYAYGPIWTSQFWTSPLQRILVRDLSLISDNCLTSKNTYADIIQRFSKFKHVSITVLPVFSNLGEPENVLPLSKRNKTLVVFGNAKWRSRVYKNNCADLNMVIKVLGISKVIDIGSALDFPIKLDVSIEVEILGNLPSEQISTIFSHSLVGFFNYPTGYLSKSGIFASYCAHGLLPIGSWDQNQISDGVESGIHFLRADNISQEISSDDIQNIASNALDWYRSHNLAIHSKIFADILD